MLPRGIREIIADGKQQDIKLFRTRKCLELFRYAYEHNYAEVLCDELWKLCVAMAKTEWGDDTLFDDFSVEGKIVVTNKFWRMEL